MDDKYASLRLKNQLCFPLYAVSNIITRKYKPLLDKLDLTYTQYIVMMVLWEYGGMTEGELGKIVRLDSGTLAPLLKRLEKQGLLQRSRPEENERKLFLKLTPAGEAMKEEALAIPCAMRDCIQMPAEELLLLRELLNKALHSMETRKAYGSEL